MTLLDAIGHTARRHGAGSLGQRSRIGRRNTIPAPVMGLNTRDALAKMKPGYAITMRNYLADRGAARLRKGSREYATGVGTAHVQSLIPHYSGDVEKFYAVGGGSLYDVTSSGAVGAALMSGLSGNRWSHEAAGGSTILVNGADDPMRIQPDGTLASAHGWTGITTASNLSRVMLFKTRLFFPEKDTAKVWYGPVSGVQGELNSLDFSYVAPEGGNVVDIGTMTIDSGEGIDDLFLVFMQNGVVLLYTGINPAAIDATGFSLQGRFKIGELVGDRPLVNVGGDLIVMTVDGVIAMAETLKEGRRGDTQTTVNDAIAPSLRNDAQIHGNADGWDAILHPPASLLLFNVPLTGGRQYAMHTQTGAWAEFTGWDARCFGRFQDKLYFGSADGKVFEAWTGTDDAGTAIEGDVQTAYDYLGTPHDKRITMLRSFVEADGTAQFRLGSSTDFAPRAELAAPSSLVSTGTPWATETKATGKKWATAIKPTGNKWGAGNVQLQTWQATNRTGAAISVRLRSSTRGTNLAMYATDVIYEPAPGIL